MLKVLCLVTLAMLVGIIQMKHIVLNNELKGEIKVS